jgi:hypothetical protein
LGLCARPTVQTTFDGGPPLLYGGVDGKLQSFHNKQL